MMERIAIKGTPFEIGLALGRIGRPAAGMIVAALARDDDAVSTARAAAVFLQERVQGEFPCYWDELRGMSAGLGLDIRDVFAWNCWPDVAASDSSASSTIAVNRLGYGLVLHNLRLGPALARLCTLVDVETEGKPGFLSLYVPGRLPGLTFAANRAGVVQVAGQIVGERQGTGLPSFLVGRAVLDARSLPEALDIVMECERFGSAHHMLASSDEFVMLNATATPAGPALMPIPNKYWHTNHRVQKRVPDGMKTSSHERYRALGELLDQLPSHPTEYDILAMLQSLRMRPQDAPAGAAEIVAAEGEIGTALIKILPKRIEVRLVPAKSGDEQRVVVPVECW
jgi:hypothetical protein